MGCPGSYTPEKLALLQPYSSLGIETHDLMLVLVLLAQCAMQLSCPFVAYGVPLQLRAATSKALESFIA